MSLAAIPPLQRSGKTLATFSIKAIEDFLAGRVKESVTGFDRVAALVPDVAPQLWQRGIALYYVGRYDDCRRQFESHRTVNPNDVENPAWHFLCVAHAESPAKARAALLPVGPDQRSPMREVYEMFKGTMTPEAVLAAAAQSTSARFFAELYVGLVRRGEWEQDSGTHALEGRSVGTGHKCGRLHASRRDATPPIGRQ